METGIPNAEFVFEDGKYITGTAIEKMSKTYYNVVNPDDVIAQYSTDTFRMYEMFLGPLEQSKPWNTNGIDGVFRFLRKFWNLAHDNNGNFKVSDEEPTKEELKVLHKTLKKISQDVNNFSFNTSVSEFMICANELGSLKCNKRKVIEPLVIALSPFAPHIAKKCGRCLAIRLLCLRKHSRNTTKKYLTESSFNYPISINGKGADRNQLRTRHAERRHREASTRFGDREEMDGRKDAEESDCCAGKDCECCL